MTITPTRPLLRLSTSPARVDNPIGCVVGGATAHQLVGSRGHLGSGSIKIIGRGAAAMTAIVLRSLPLVIASRGCLDGIESMGRRAAVAMVGIVLRMLSIGIDKFATPILILPAYPLI